MTETRHPLTVLAARLASWQPLSDDDLSAILALPQSPRTLRANEFMVREKDHPRESALLLSGFVIRQKVVESGKRQILALHMDGDMIDIHNTVLTRADHNVQALTQSQLVMIPVDAIRQLAAERPLIARALWSESLVDMSIFRQWALNSGQREGRERMAHLLCELDHRLRLAGLSGQWGFKMPMNQKQLADALSITNVYVTRLLTQLTQDELIERPMYPYIRIADKDRLATVAGFDPQYLHHRRGQS